MRLLGLYPTVHPIAADQVEAAHEAVQADWEKVRDVEQRSERLATGNGFIDAVDAAQRPRRR